jgi:hypothetical protein
MAHRAETAITELEAANLISRKLIIGNHEALAGDRKDKSGVGATEASLLRKLSPACSCVSSADKY